MVFGYDDGGEEEDDMTLTLTIFDNISLEKSAGSKRMVKSLLHTARKLIELLQKEFQIQHIQPIFIL